MNEAVIGMRETFEAALVISLIGTSLVKSRRENLLPSLWKGALAGTAASILFGVLLFLLGESFDASEILEGAASLIASLVIAFVVLMFSSDYVGRLKKKASESKSRRAVFLLSFFAVAREGFELVLMAAALIVSLSISLGYLIAGVVAGASIGFAIYKGLLRASSRKLFSFTNFLLVLIGAGLFSYGIHELQESGLVPVIIERLWDLTIIPNESALGFILKALFSYDANPSLLQALGFFLYGGALLFLMRRKPDEPSHAKA
ncbi:hypothetical protein D6764_05610 [Candidatus Woesearchaeota archaeon]|nr:MAG: hypothetical protein D6764_05610 [Candidatus Woesearchaeota archaeon]